MKQIVIKAYHQSQAIEIAKNNYGINVQYDGTSQWKRQGCPLEGFPFVRACLNILDNYTDRQVNTGIIINLDFTKGRRRILSKGYKTDKCVMLRGKLRRQLQRITEVRDMVTGEILGEFKYKKDALRVARAHVAATKNNTYGIAKFIVKDPEASIIFKVEMAPEAEERLKRFLIVVLDQMGNVKAKVSNYANKHK